MTTTIPTDLDTSSPDEPTAAQRADAEQVVPDGHTLPALLADALTGSRIVDGQLMWLSADVRDDGHLVVEATRARFDEPTDVAVRVILDVGPPEPIDLRVSPIEDDLMECGCHAGYCYCDGYDPADASATCPDCGRLECECTVWVPAVRADGDDPDPTEPSPS